MSTDPGICFSRSEPFLSAATSAWAMHSAILMTMLRQMCIRDRYGAKLKIPFREKQRFLIVFSLKKYRMYDKGVVHAAENIAGRQSEQTQP